MTLETRTSVDDWFAVPPAPPTYGERLREIGWVRSDGTCKWESPSMGRLARLPLAHLISTFYTTSTLNSDLLMKLATSKYSDDENPACRCFGGGHGCGCER